MYAPFAQRKGARCEASGGCAGGQEARKVMPLQQRFVLRVAGIIAIIKRCIMNSAMFVSEHMAFGAKGGSQEIA